MGIKLKPQPGREIPFIIFLVFLLTFVTSRLLVLIFPQTSLYIKDTHIHHFTYGIILLSLTGYISIAAKLSYPNRLRLSIPYGIGLGLAFDEFAMWLQLENVYYSRTNYDAIIVISLILLNIVYFTDFWKKWGKRLNQLVKIIIITGPQSIFKLVLSLIKKF